MIKKQANKKRSSFHLLLLLMVSVILLLTIYKSYIFLTLFIIPILYILIAKVKLKLCIIYLVLSVVPTLIYFFIKDFNFLTYIVKLIEEKSKFSIRNSIASYLDKNYDNLTASFIKLMVLNIKVDESYYLYKKMIGLSIVYLIVISGFHLMFIKKIINFLFKKWPKISFICNSLIFFSYCYLLNFSASVLRVLLTHIFSKTIKKYSYSPYESTSMSGIFSLMCFPSCCFSYSFALSYICTIGVIYVISLDLSNKIIEKILVNVCAIAISLPIVMQINSQISIVAIINSLIFSYLFCFIFVWFFIFGFITFLYPIHQFITNVVFNIVEGFNIVNIKIDINIFNSWVCCIYYILFFILIMITYKKNNIKW